jgi:hypothetical protein
MSLPPAAAPLGVPVVPEVYMITAISSGSGLHNSFSDLEAVGEAWFNVPELYKLENWCIRKFYSRIVFDLALWYCGAVLDH